MLKSERIVDTCMLTVGGAYSLANIESILGIINISIQLTWIAAKLLIKIVNKIKHKKSLKSIIGDIFEAAQDSLDLRNDFLEEESNQDGQDSES